MINLSPTWRLVLLVAAVGLVPTLVFANWLSQQWTRSYLGARWRVAGWRGWWRS